MKEHLNHIWQLQRGLCWICEELMLRYPRGHPIAWSVDHLYPRSAGGTRKPKNILLAHRDCNTRRGNALLDVGGSVKAFRDKVFSRLDVVDRRKERFRTVGHSPTYITKEP